MEPNDRQAFLEVVIGFAELKGKALSAPALELYWNAMQDWDITEFRQAAQTLLRTCEFMPTPKDFCDLKKAALPTAGDAWAKVLQHLKGGYRTGGLDPATDRAVAALGGYRTLAMLPSTELHWHVKAFTENYEPGVNYPVQLENKSPDWLDKAIEQERQVRKLPQTNGPR